MESEEEQARLTNVKAFLNQMLEVTARLVRIDAANKPVGVSSGFILERGDELYLLGAYHSLKNGRYCLESNVSHEGDTLLLTFDSYVYFRRFEVGFDGLDSDGQPVDFGWMKIDPKRLADEFNNDPRMKGKELNLVRYLGPLTGKGTLSPQF